MGTLGCLFGSLGQAAVLRESAHRPWPLPERPWYMAQTWEQLLFAHWPVAVEELRRVVPSELSIDTHDGTAWVGVTPFRVGASRLRALPHVPGLTSFPETNVRTYATVEGKPGIYFLSLDAASRLAVRGARRVYRLPYFRATMSARRSGDWVDYETVRVAGDGPPAELRGRYRPSGERFNAVEGSIEYFLTERYCLYTLDEGRRLHRADIHHPPWPLQRAEASFAVNTMAAGFGLPLDAQPGPLLHYAERQDVLIWTIQPVGEGNGSQMSDV